MMKVNESPDQASLGAILQQARELRGLTQAQAANQLNLKVSVIVQMETEQWDPKVAATFMRGYLRSYARLLKLSEQEILQAYALQTAYLKQHPEMMKSFSHKTRKDAAENRFMLATYFVVVLLIGLFLVSVWQTHLVDEKPVSVLPAYPENATTQSEAAVISADPQFAQAQGTEVVQVGTASNSTVLQSEDQSAAAELSSGKNLDEMNVAPAATAAVSTAAVSTAATENAASSAEQDETNHEGAEPSEQSASVSSAKPTLSQNPVPDPSAEQANVSGNSAGMGTITMQFRQGCWVGIEDRHGKRLAYQMYQAGQEAKITGEFPLKVTLGEPTAVTLQLNDSSIDLSQYQPGRVARLTLNGPN